MNDTKHDIEKIGEVSTRRTLKLGKTFSKVSTGITARSLKIFRKYFVNPMRAVEKDGGTKRLAISPPLTKDEAKKVIVKSREEGVLVCLKEMQPDGESGRGRSLFHQGQMAKHDFKAVKWKERSKHFKHFAPAAKLCTKLANHHTTLSNEDSKSEKDKRFIIICNESRLSFMNDRLQDIENYRIQKSKDNELEDINKDGIIDELDISNLHTYDMDMEPDKLESGKDYGSCMIRDYHENYCIQTVPKEEYCTIRKEMFNLRSHGAYVLNDSEVLLAFPKADLKEFLKYGSTAYPIHEYGKYGGNEINKESNHNNLISLEVEDTEEMDKLRNLYKDKDYIAVLNQDGSYSILVKEKDTESIVDMSKKKSSTASLLEEAREFMKQQEKEKTDNILPTLSLDSDKELEHDY